MFKHTLRAAAGALAIAPAAFGDALHTYEDLSEGPLGTTFAYEGATYRDANQVSGFFPDGLPFTPVDLGGEFLVEQADLFYFDFPGYGSPVNALTFGNAYIPGDNLTIGPLASVWIDLDEPANAASLDLAYYENGPWGGIEYVVDAVMNGAVVASDSFFIANDDDGRDNPTFATMSVSGAVFDSLHVYALLNGEFTAPRGMIDDLSVTAVPAPASALALMLGVLPPRRRR